MRYPVLYCTNWGLPLLTAAERQRRPTDDYRVPAPAPLPADNNHTEERLYRTCPAWRRISFPLVVRRSLPPRSPPAIICTNQENQNDKIFSLYHPGIENEASLPFLEQVLAAWCIHYRQKDKAKRGFFFRRWLPGCLTARGHPGKPTACLFHPGAVRNELPCFRSLSELRKKNSTFL